MKKIIYKIALLLISIVSLTGCDSLGEKKEFNKLSLYYTSEIRESQADSLGKFLVDQKFADGNEKTVQITKTDKTYEFKFVVKKGIETDNEYYENCKLFAATLSSELFGGSQVDVHLCDDQMKTLKVAPMAIIPEITTEGMNSFDNDIFTIKYPADWQMDDSGVMGTSVVLSAPADKAISKFNQNVTVLVQDLTGQGIDLKKYTDISMEQIKTLITNSVVIENTTLSSGNDQYQKVVYTGKQGQMELQFIQHYFIKNDKAFVVTATCEKANFDKCSKVAEVIMSSFLLY